MANRVILGEFPWGGHGLRVSVPGQNVLNGDLRGDRVAFDSEWLGSSRIVKMGSVSVPTGNSTRTVNYGVTLAEVPVVIGMGNVTGGSPANYWRMMGGHTLVHGIDFDDPSEVNSLLDYTTQPTFMRIYRDRFELPARGMFHPTGLSLSYIVLQR